MFPFKYTRTPTREERTKTTLTSQPPLSESLTEGVVGHRESESTSPDDLPVGRGASCREPSGEMYHQNVREGQ